MKNNNIKYFGIFLAIILIIILIWLSFKQTRENLQQNDFKLKQLVKKLKDYFHQNKIWTGSLEMLNHKKNVLDNINFYKANESYCINKQKIYVCLKDEHDDYYEDNILIYVLAHEISHVLCNSIGHTEEFKKIFNQILVELEKHGLYDKTKPFKENYCKF